MPIAPRQVLSRLRRLMAGDGAAEDRLAELVRLVAAEMVAEVCSVYVMRAGEILELWATEGLRQEAVRNTRLRVGEGIVGSVAATGLALNLADAQNHPAFVYRAETGEGPFAALLGVPVRRAGRVLGVIAVQNREPRTYGEEEVETLETVAMLLAEMLATEADAPDSMADLKASLPRHFEGAGLAPGLALGPIFRHGQARAAARLLAEDTATELGRLEAATLSMQQGLDTLLAGPALAMGETREVLEAYRLIAADAGWLSRVADAVRAGFTAEAAVERVLAELVGRMGRVTDPYIRERLADLEDAGNRLLLELGGADAVAPLPERFLLAARRLGPAELIDYHARGLAGLVLEEGTATAHATLIARALDIPMLGGCRGALAALVPGEPAVLDAEEGRLILRPEAELAASYQVALQARAARRVALAGLRHLAATTTDGVHTSIMINAGLLLDLAQLDAVGADGIGLFRTEIAFMAQGGVPDAAAQEAMYARVVAAANGKPVHFRTLDAGGDKVLPGLEQAEEENPAMGWRSIRLSLDRPALFRRQLRAMLRAARGTTLRVMFPMVATVEEFTAARRMLDDEARRMGSAGPDRLLAGAMLEVPALLWQLPLLLRRVDFLSIGSNDLTQFVFAADRGSARLAGRYDFLSGPMLGLLEQVAQAASAASKPLSLCGEAASRPLEALAVAGLGIRIISMPPAAVPAVKAALRATDMGAFRTFLAGLRQAEGGGASLRGALAAWARDHGVPV
jgi:phosphotransferase system enzyme I (PtsP)